MKNVLHKAEEHFTQGRETPNAGKHNILRKQIFMYSEFIWSNNCKTFNGIEMRRFIKIISKKISKENVERNLRILNAQRN